VLSHAAKQGIRGVGYELNPLMVLVAKIVTWRHRKVVKIVWGDFWKADLSRADGVFVFLLDRYMPKLDEKIQTEARENLPVVSFAFKIPGKKPKKTKAGLFLYVY
jgi:hypothetical protein